MINLLPNKTKQNLIYARRNSILLHWTIGFHIAIFGVALIVISGVLYINDSIEALNKQTENAQVLLEQQDISETQQKVEEISNNVKLTIDVLSEEVLFSKLIQQIGAALPAGTALQQLQINDTTGGISLRALATDFTTASQIQVNLDDPKNKVFEKSDIEQIDCDSTTELEGYNCSVQIRALFGDNSQYLYIKDEKKGAN